MDGLPKRSFGDTGLEVAMLGYGAMQLRQEEVGNKEASSLLNYYLDNGGNFIDTAPDYGKSEEMIGKHLAHRRNEFILATKCGCDIFRNSGFPSPSSHVWTGKQVRHNVELSLKRMKTDRIDLLQIHSGLPSDVINTDVVDTMLSLKDAGKIGHIAVSVRQGDEWNYGHDMLLDYLDWGVFEAMQIWYSLFVPINKKEIEIASGKGIGTIIHGCVKGTSPSTVDEDFERYGLDDLRSQGESRRQFMLRFASILPGINTMIIGTTNLDHMRDNIRAIRMGPPAKEIIEEVDSRMKR